MKDIASRLVSELMKNSRRSNKQLAKGIGRSQPTVSGIFKKMEKQGLIRENTLIPDCNKLGYEIVAFTFMSLCSNISPARADFSGKHLARMESVFSAF
jgi:DNA-binding Lrp family transcriptional regulator